MYRVLTAYRTLIVTDNPVVLEFAPHHVLASDGVYVPKCDLSQYEAGEREVRETVTL